MLRTGRGWLVRFSVVVAVCGIALFISYSWIISLIGGAFDDSNSDKKFSVAAQTLIDRAFSDIDAGKLKDYHVHVIGLNQPQTGAWVSPRLLSWWGLHHKIKGDVFLNSAGITDIAHFDDQYVGRLVSLVEQIPIRGKYQLLAFDYYYRPNGKRSVESSEFYVPNDYVFALAERYPEFFTLAVSVHPYRPDAIERLEYWAQQGVRFVKWLPNAQGMKPDDPALDDYYSTLRQNQMILLTHVGEELAVSSDKRDQALGNPLLFRRALDQGLKMIMAHAGSLGQSMDNSSGKWIDNFELFMQMMDTPDYRDNLFGDISAITQFNRLPGPLKQLLERSDIHDRLVNGSDYPLPAINVVISTQVLAFHGFITDHERQALNEIYRINPLLFDFVTKRTLRHPATGAKFPAEVFMINNKLEGTVP